MSDIDAVVRINELTLLSNGMYTIAVKPEVSTKGDVGYLGGLGATEIKFKIAGSMDSAAGWKYSFKSMPFCSYTTGASCTAVSPPANDFKITNRTNKTFVLEIPDLGTSTTEYNYLLFAQRKDKDGNTEDITIDPKIKPGSVSYAEQSPQYTNKAVGPTSMALVGAALLLVALGFALGWMLAGGERKPL